MKRKICFITGSRAEYGLLRKLIIMSQEDKLVNTQIIVTGSHLSKKHGYTLKEIEKDDIKISDKVNLNLKGDSPKDVIHSMSIGLKGFSDSFNKLQPDLIVILGDRYEIFAVATAAMIMNIPIAHIHGGEVTEGAYDEAIRHAISKMAHMPFVAAPEYRKKVIQDDTYTIDHSSGLYLIDKQGKIRIRHSYGAESKLIIEDIEKLI